MQPLKPLRRLIHHCAEGKLHPIDRRSRAALFKLHRPWIVIGGGLAALLLSSIATPALPPTDPQLTYSVSGCEDVSLPSERVMAQGEATTCFKTTPTSHWAFLGGDPVRNVAIGFENGRLTFAHELTFTCCASFVLDRSIDRSVNPPVISIVERDVGEHCRCLCDYQVAGMIGPLPPGSYVVRVYGEFGNGKSRVLLFERSASVPHGLLDPPATGASQPARR